MPTLTFPQTIDNINLRQWESFEPYFADLQHRSLNGDVDALRQWLTDWSTLSKLIWEAGGTIYIDKSLDTADKEKEQLFLDFIGNVSPPAQVAEQKLKERLLALDGIDEALPDMALALRDLRDEADLFREENVPLKTELAKLANDYDKITGALQTEWDGEKKNLTQLRALLQDKDRTIRERAWRAMMALWIGKRPSLNKLYADMLPLREQLAANAGLADYRAYIFREKGRFDYTPEDCFVFHDAIEAVVAPAVERIYEKRRARLGLNALRPWDVTVEATDAPALTPYQGQEDLIQRSLNIFHQLDAELSRYFAAMAEEELLDLDTRTGKALGGYCATLPLRKRPFIFMNGTGQHDDVQTLLHEAGHAFHAFESTKIPMVWQMKAPMEFCEVASMAMELLTAPYLTEKNGGFYTEAEAARARIEHLEGILTFLPYMAVVDAFQHWVYTNPIDAADAANCDAAWDRLWERFMPAVDWSGLEEIRKSGWHRKLHIFTVPFYYIEYGMAQIGALQVWRNSLTDQAGAIAAYRRALELGGTKSLPDLFVAAGAEFRFDTAMLTDLVDLIENTIEELEAVGT